MSEAFKVCPICETANHRNAAFCMNCGAALSGVRVLSSSSSADNSPASHYDYRYGETDLFEGSLRRTAQRYLFAIILTLSLLMLGGAGLIFAPRFTEGLRSGVEDSTTEERILFKTNIPRPTMDFPTVTPGTPTRTASATQPPQPTATLTPTREPCMQEVLPDDGLISIVTRCGHRDLFVITEVIELNDLVDAGDIRPGEILEIPWPTETIDPNITLTLESTQVAAIAAVTEVADITTGDSAQVSVDLTLLADPFFVPTSTLPPGVMYHIVRPDDNAIIISEMYVTNVEVLSQLNPEITFSQCDFGQTFGGPRCIVPLAQGQLVRVPAPTPTPTLSPTPSGSETATLTPTPTYNAPFAISPDNFAYFRKDQVVTLRWGGTGVLLDGYSYQVTVDRLNDGLTFSATTDALSFVLPDSWQGSGTGRYEYQWTISVIDTAKPQKLNYTTQLRSFTWEGIGEEK